MLNKYKIGICKTTIDNLISEHKPYMMDVTVVRFAHAPVKANYDDLLNCLVQYKTDTSGWYEGKKDALVIIFDNYFKSLYAGLQEQFKHDLESLTNSYERSASATEIKIKLNKLIATGSEWLKM
jgi:hypothetical protein